MNQIVSNTTIPKGGRNLDRRLSLCINDIDDFKPDLLNRKSVGIELQDFAYPDVLDDDLQRRTNKYKEKLEDFNQQVTIHGPFLDLNPGSPDKRIGAVTKERYLQAVRAALDLDASYLILHSQHNLAIKDPKVKEKKIENQLPFWDEILEKISEDDLKILLENVTENDPEDLFKLVDKIDSEKVKICLDVGHILVHSSVELDKWMKELSEYIEYVHLHWNNGDFDSHKVAPDTFISRFFEMADENKMDPRIALEYEIDGFKEEIKRIESISQQ